MLLNQNTLHITAIKELTPTAKFRFENGNGYDNLVWLEEDESNKPTESAFDSKLSELQTRYNSHEYQRNRVNEYPTIEEQLDKIYHEGIDAWKATIKAVKDKYPKSKKKKKECKNTPL